MPIKRCTKDGQPGYKWGDSGTCYTGPDAKRKAGEQAQAAYASGYGKSESFRSENDFVKMADELGLVLGWSIICTRDGEPYFDTQGHHIPEDVMLSAASDFMLKSRVAGDSHETVDGDVVFLFPITSEIKKAFNLQVNETGLLIGVKPSEEVYAKFKSGEYTGFSIGGKCTDWENI